MAIVRVKIKGGFRYKAVWRDRSGRQRYKTFDTRNAARNYAEAKRLEAKADDSPAESSLTITQLADTFLEKANPKANTKRAWKSAIKRHIKPYIGDIRAQDLDADTVQEFLEYLRDKPDGRRKDKGSTLSRKTVKNILDCLRHILDSAPRKVLKANPCAGLRVPRRPEDHRVNIHAEDDDAHGLDGRYLDEIQADIWTEIVLKNIDASRPERALFVCYLVEGVRGSEPLGSIWEDVTDQILATPLRPFFPIKRSWDREDEFITPKSRSARREIPLFPDFALALKEWYLACEDKSPKARIFPLQLDGFRKLWGQMVKLSRAENERRAHNRPFPDITPKGMRHTFATIHANRFGRTEDGPAPKTLQAWMGHSNFSVTMDVYAHCVREDWIVLPKPFGSRVSEKLAVNE